MVHRKCVTIQNGWLNILRFLLQEGRAELRKARQAFSCPCFFIWASLQIRAEFSFKRPTFFGVEKVVTTVFQYFTFAHAVAVDILVP
jgi:hypothetical protein